MKQWLMITLVGLTGLSVSAFAQVAQEREDTRYQFNYFSFEYISHQEGTSANIREYEAIGPGIRFAKNFSRFFHVRGELKQLGFENIDMDRKSVELGIGGSFLSTERHNLYAALTVVRETIEGDLSSIIPGTANSTNSASIDNYAALFGYRHHIRPGIQTIYEIKAIIPDIDNVQSEDINTRHEFGVRLHPPANDRISLGVRVAFETLKYNNLSPEDEENARDLSLFLRVDY